MQTTDRFLMLLKTRGPLTAAEVARWLSISHEGARLQLQKLAAGGLIAAAASTARGVGRPVQAWQLTPAGNARFPDTHADLSIQLIQTIQQLMGPAALEQIMTAREQSIAIHYLEQLDGIDDLAERLEHFAAIRSREGFLAECQPDADRYLFIEHHCPICSAAKECRGLCESELRIFGRILEGMAVVSRRQHIISGDRRCVYEIVPAAVTAQ